MVNVFLMECLHTYFAGVQAEKKACDTCGKEPDIRTAATICNRTEEETSRAAHYHG